MPSITWHQLPTTKQQRILDAAVEEFGTNGYQAGSLNVVARDADVAKGSLFRYFDDKLDLFAHVVAVSAAQVRAELDAHIEAATRDEDGTFELFHELLVDWVEYFRRRPLEQSLLFAATYEIDEEARAVARTALDEHLLPLVDALLDVAIPRRGPNPPETRDHLRALLVVLLPHLATASSISELDPVLSLASKDGPALQTAIGGFVDVFFAAAQSAASAPRVEQLPPTTLRRRQEHTPSLLELAAALDAAERSGGDRQDLRRFMPS